MRGMTLEEITNACGGTYYGDGALLSKEVSYITTDSRAVQPGALFVAIQGARVDGNQFIDQCYQAGALACLSEKKPVHTGKPYIVVSSCYQALKDMAKLYRKSMTLPIIGITGSVGKTTTKEMIAAVLSRAFCTLKTEGNFNNEVGVPLTLFRLRDEHEVAVVEMGISAFGEMTRLSEIVMPDHCVITNIGQCHLEQLVDRDGVLRAKTEIFTSMKPGGKIYLNGDDDKLATVKAPEGQTIRFYGIQNHAGIYAEHIEPIGLSGTRAVFVTPEESYEVTIPAPGQHMVLNALAAAAVARDLGMTSRQIRAGIADFQPLGGHGSLVQTDRFTILDDCYNANPSSVKAGLDVLAAAQGRRVAVLGDMLELGADEKSLHTEVGAYAAQKPLDLLVLIGSLARYSYEGAVQQNNKDMDIVYYETKEEAIEKLPVLLQKSDTILVKASHGMSFEKIVAVLKNQ